MSDPNLLGAMGLRGYRISVQPSETCLVVIERITTQNALVFKAVRLRALQESPTAFSSTYEKESQFPDEEWLKRSVRWSSDSSAGFLAYEGEHARGMVFCFEDENRDHGQILSMWVDPESRRTGVGRLLIESVVIWAKARQLHELKLMVTSVNEAAIAFYRRLGFTMTGKSEAYPNDPAITEFEMMLAVR